MERIAWQLSGPAPSLLNRGTGPLQAALALGCTCGSLTAHLARYIRKDGKSCIVLECDGCSRAEGNGLRLEYFDKWQSFPLHDPAKRTAYLEERTQKIRTRSGSVAWDREAERQLFYRTPEWVALRNARLALDNYTCQACGRQRPVYQLTAHHLSYRYGLAAPLFELVTVCKDPCHRRFHASKEGFTDPWCPESLVNSNGI